MEILVCCINSKSYINDNSNNDSNPRANHGSPAWLNSSTNTCSNLGRYCDSIMPIWIALARRDIADVSVEIESLWVSQNRVGYGNRLGRPVRCNESSERARVMPGEHVIQAALGIAFFAGELVMIGVTVSKLEFTAPGIVIRFRFDIASGISDDRGGLEIVGEII